jgi:hypothetical protein
VTLVDRASALKRELGDVTGDLDRLISGTLPGLDQELGARGFPPVATAPEPPPGRQVSSSVLGAGFSTFDGQSVPHLGKSKRR